MVDSLACTELVVEKSELPVSACVTHWQYKALGVEASAAQTTLGSAASVAQTTLGSAASVAQTTLGSAASVAQTTLGSAASVAQTTLGSAASAAQTTLGSAASAAQTTLGVAISAAQMTLGVAASASQTTLGVATSAAQMTLGVAASASQTTLGVATSAAHYTLADSLRQGACQVFVSVLCVGTFCLDSWTCWVTCSLRYSPVCQKSGKTGVYHLFFCQPYLCWVTCQLAAWWRWGRCVIDLSFTCAQLKVLSYLPASSLVKMGQVCREYNITYRDPCLWRRLYLREFGREWSFMDVSEVAHRWDR